MRNVKKYMGRGVVVQQAKHSIWVVFIWVGDLRNVLASSFRSAQFWLL